MTDITLAIDPGKHHAGWAIFIDKLFVRGGVAKVKPARDTHGPYYRQGKHKQAQAQSAYTIAEIIGAHVAVARNIIGADTTVDVVCEHMHIYLDENRKYVGEGDPGDLIYIQSTSGAIAGEIRAPKRVRYVEAAEWKKQRGDASTWKMIRDVLGPGETAVAKACGIYDEHGSLGKGFHHGLEACGIGAWACFRL